MIVPAVAVEVGVKARADRNAKPAGNRDGNYTQGALGGDVDQIRALLCPEFLQMFAAGLTERSAFWAGLTTVTWCPFALSPWQRYFRVFATPLISGGKVSETMAIRRFRG